MNCIFRNMALAVAAFAATGLCAKTEYWGYASEKTCSYRTGKRFNTGTAQGFAIKVDAAKARLLSGHKITGLRALFSTGSDASEIKAFVGTAPGVADICSQEVDGIRPRFTDYMFDEPYTITGDRDLYAGFTFNYSSANTNLFSVDWTLELPSGLVWAYTGRDWETVACDGAPAIYLILDGAPAYTDVMVKPVSLEGFYTAGKSYDFAGQIVNVGTETVTSLELSFGLGDEGTVTRRVEGLKVAPRSTYDFTIADCALEKDGILPITITASNVNGAADADESDNNTTSSKYIYPQGMARRTLLEEFTGFDCPNCPTGNAVIAQAIAGREDDFVLVAHHTFGQPYGNDKFSMKEDNEYKWFFNGQQYAPGLMANRLPYIDGLTNPVVAANNAPYTSAVISVAGTRPPYVGVDLTTVFDEASRQLTATVFVTTYEQPAHAANRLNVFITQNGVPAGREYAQSGAPANYVHNHIFRGALTGAWGEDIELKAGETVTRTFTYTVPEAIVSTFSNPEHPENSHALPVVLDDMRVVAFVGGVTGSQTDCPVYNVVEAALTGESTGIKDVAGTSGDTGLYVSGSTVTAGSGVTSLRAYNMQGVLVADGQGSLELAPGLYVLRATASDGTSIVRKTIIR